MFEANRREGAGVVLTVRAVRSTQRKSREPTETGQVRP